MALGSILPSLLLDDPSQSSLNLTSGNTQQQREAWKNETHYALLLLYSPCICILSLLLLLFISFAADLPAKPPTYTLWVKRVMNSNLQAGDKSFSCYIFTLMPLYTDVNFVLCSIVLGISFNMIIYSSSFAYYCNCRVF